MRAEYRHITDIKPYINPPWYSDGAVEQVVLHFKAFGVIHPILVDEHGFILVGHTRYKAAQRLYIVFIPVIEIHNITDETKRALRWMDI